MAVIGAGIHGAGVAQAAASMGYSVCLVEQSAVAAGTSSRSSKLIHGGLRYLETAQVGLVRECLRERRILLTIAPQLVKLIPFYIPVYRHSKRPPWQIGIGLQLYSALSGFGRDTRATRLADSAFDALNGLTRKDLRAVFQYYDAQTDDVRLTQAVIDSAVRYSAKLLMPAQVLKIEPRSTGFELQVEHAGDRAWMAARCVVNAAGPWVNHVHQRLQDAAPPYAIDLVQGAHIVVQREAAKAAFYVESPHDRRAVFVLPWQGLTMIGTTETAFYGDPATVTAQQSEIDYLTDCYNYYFPQAAVAAKDIQHSFAGLRVLPTASTSHNARNRETLLLNERQRCPGYVAIYGGKLTAYRHTATRVMQILQAFLPAPKQPLQTQTIKL